MPNPRSATRICTRGGSPPGTCVLTSTVAPLGLYLTALPTMFCTADRSASHVAGHRGQRAIGVHRSA